MKVAIVCYKRSEAGSETDFKIVGVYEDKKTAEAIACNCNSEIDESENEENGVEEEYWVEARKVQ